MSFKVEPVQSSDDWEEVCAIREAVFINEQNCPPDEEWDEHDATSRHFIGRLQSEPIAAARWRTVPVDGELAAKLERFAVLKAHRGEGFGRALVRAVMDDARRAGFTVLYLHAQEYLLDFYRSFGFEARGERFMEAGIPHRAMIKREDQPSS